MSVSIVSLKLIDTANGNVTIAHLGDGSFIDLSRLGPAAKTYTIAAETLNCAGVGCIVMQANGAVVQAERFRGLPPFSLAGRGVPAGTILKPGVQYVLKFIPYGGYDGATGKGTLAGEMRQFNISVTSGVTPDPPPPVNGIVLTDAILATPPWANRDGKVVMLPRGTSPVVPKSWGDCHAQGFTLCAEPGTGPLPRLLFQDGTAGAWLANLQYSTGCTIQDIDVVTGPDVTANRNGFKLGGTDLTLRNVGFGGGRDQLYGVDAVVKNLHLIGLRSLPGFNIGGNFAYAGASVAGRYSGFLAQDWHVECGMAGIAGIAHPLRLYDVGDARLVNNFIDVRAASQALFAQYVNARSTSGLRLHRGTAGINVTGGTYAGFQNWFSPLHDGELPLAHVRFAGVTLGGSTNVNTGATDITFDGGKFITGASFALSLGLGSQGRITNNDFQTTAQNVVFDHTSGGWTFAGNTRNGVAWR
jgi:hypothetical protein